MAPSFLATFASALAIAPSALAGFTSSGVDNLSVYWGQNSANGANTQDRLKTYCDDNGIDIINISFLIGVATPAVNFASASNACTAIAGTQLEQCPEIEADITYCQSQGKTIMLSIGGATYSEGGFSSASAAQTAAQNIWSLFGSDTSAANRPFGSAVVDGFDFDLESTNQNFAPFANELRSLMDADTSKTYYLSAAPQCVFPDAADNDMLNGAVPFDWINIQFYNNFCGIINFSNPNAWNFGTWDNWAKTTSKNPDVKILIGAPASSTAGGGYVDVTTLSSIVQSTAAQYSSFGGVMLWDMSQLFQNTGFLTGIVSALGGLTSGGSGNNANPTTTAPATTAAPTTAQPTTLATSTKSASSPSTTGLAQWAQCGGQGYTGPTTCASPFTCVATSVWWSQCE